MTDLKPLTEQQLTDIETRANAATPGPWLQSDFADFAEIKSPDGAFIAHAREDVPALLAEVRRLRAELDEAAEDVSWLRCLEAAGVDNWEGDDEAIQAAESASS